MISPFTDAEYPYKDYYYTHAISDHAVRFISEHGQQAREKPFFLYVAYTAAHWPMHALERDIAKYSGKYDSGYDAIRRERFERMKKLGLIDPAWQFTRTVGDWESVKNHDWEARCMEVYAAMIDSMDQGIGRIVAQLKQQKQLDNTLIFFLQDNGGCAETVGRMPRDGVTQRMTEPLLAPKNKSEPELAVIPRSTRDGFAVVMGPGVMPGPRDTYIAYGQGWANVSNTPLREYKHWVHEGGISTPLIAHWPAGIPRRGELERQPGHLIDLMATCVDVAGAAYPNERDGQRIQPLEGRSLAPAFAGNRIEREAIYWEHEGNRAMRADQWKLVAKGPAGKWELYDMQADRTETHNLAQSQAERVNRMVAQWEAWARRAHVLPWIWNPAYGAE
jgi:arylsulfatase